MSGEGSYGGTDNLEVMAEAKRYNRFLVSLVTKNLSRNGRCLDFGAGIGTFATEVSARGFEVDALDAEPVHQEEIRARGLTSVADLDDVPGGSYAGVYSLNVLEHIEQDEQILDEFLRILEPGGKAVIYVPAMSWLFTSMDVKVGHVRRYHLRELVRKMGSAGFVVNRASYADSLGVLATLAYKAVGSRDGSLDTRGVRAYDTVGFPVSKALDTVFGQLVGKNVWAVGTKPARPQ